MKWKGQNKLNQFLFPKAGPISTLPWILTLIIFKQKIGKVGLYISRCPFSDYMECQQRFKKPWLYGGGITKISTFGKQTPGIVQLQTTEGPPWLKSNCFLTPEGVVLWTLMNWRSCSSLALQLAGPHVLSLLQEEIVDVDELSAAITSTAFCGWGLSQSGGVATHHTLYWI